MTEHMWYKCLCWVYVHEFEPRRGRKPFVFGSVLQITYKSSDPHFWHKKMNDFAFSLMPTKWPLISCFIRPTHRLPRNRLNNTFQYQLEQYLWQISVVGLVFNWQQISGPLSASPTSLRRIRNRTRTRNDVDHFLRIIKLYLNRQTHGIAVITSRLIWL